MEKEFYVAMFGFFGVVVSQLITYLSQKKNNKKANDELKEMVTAYDTKQDAKLELLSDDVNQLKNDLKETKEYTHELKTIKVLKNTISTCTQEIIQYNHIVNNTFNALLTHEVNLFLKLIDIIVDTDYKGLTVDNKVNHDYEKFIECRIKNFISVQSLELWQSTKWDAIDTIVYLNEDGSENTSKSFRYRLKNEMVYVYRDLYWQRLKDEVFKEEKKFNGTFSKISLSTIKSMVDKTIQIYRECQLK